MRGGVHSGPDDIFSTDEPQNVALHGKHGWASHCLCVMRETGCVICGHRLGYHVTEQCRNCFEIGNNGHTWLLFKDAVRPILLKHLRWAELVKQGFEEPPER